MDNISAIEILKTCDSKSNSYKGLLIDMDQLAIQ